MQKFEFTMWFKWKIHCKIKILQLWKFASHHKISIQFKHFSLANRKSNISASICMHRNSILQWKTRVHNKQMKNLGSENRFAEMSKESWKTLFNMIMSFISPVENTQGNVTKSRIQLRAAINGYRSGTVNSNTVNSKYRLIWSFFKIFARFPSFHV